MEATAYLGWNRAIRDAVTRGVAKGLPVYLDTDLDRIGEVGISLLGEGTQPQEAVHGFLGAVRETCIRGGEVTLAGIGDTGADGQPQCVAFLALMVFAAYEMADDETARANNYFKRLRAGLGLPIEQGGRPEGLETGAEERLWLSWNRWLAGAGWVPTALGGEGPMRYINYARSQTLLRRTDRDKLQTLYGESSLAQTRYWDPAQHVQWLARHAARGGLTSNLRSVLTGPDLDRRSALGVAVADLVESLAVDPTGLVLRRVRRPRCGLYRAVHELTDHPRYLLLVQLPRDIDVTGAKITTESGILPLRRMKDVWLWPIAAKFQLGQPLRFAVDGLVGIDEFALPERDHWVLVRDPDDPEYGMYGTWCAPELGETFIVLGDACCREQLEQLRSEDVIAWGDERPADSAEGWVEWRDCKVLSPSWGHINPVMPSLFEELRPSKHGIGVSFAGGLSGPDRGSWMVGHSPAICAAVFGRCRIELRSVTDGSMAFTAEASGEKTVELPTELPAGDYILEFHLLDGDGGADGVPARARSLRLYEWKHLPIGTPAEELATSIGDHRIRGALVDLPADHPTGGSAG